MKESDGKGCNSLQLSVVGGGGAVGLWWRRRGVERYVNRIKQKLDKLSALWIVIIIIKVCASVVSRNILKILILRRRRRLLIRHY